MATVLFTDLVGSTELLSRLGEAAFDGLRRAHFDTLRDATRRSGGAPAWLAQARLEWARTLLTRGFPGDAERAKELLEQVPTAARELGLGSVERRAVTMGERPSRTSA